MASKSNQNSARQVKREYNPFKYSSEMKAIGCWEKATKERREEERQEQLRKEKEEAGKEAERVFQAWLKSKKTGQPENQTKKKVGKHFERTMKACTTSAAKLKASNITAVAEANPRSDTSKILVKKITSNVSFPEDDALKQERVFECEYCEHEPYVKSRHKGKTFMYSDETKELIKKQKAEKEQRAKEAELALDAQKAAARQEAEDVWEFWLSQKNCELAEKKRKLQELAEQVKNSVKNSNAATEAYNEWQKLKIQLGQDRKLEAEHDRIKQEMQTVKNSDVCENAYNCWLARKNNDKRFVEAEHEIRWNITQKMQADQKKFNKQLRELSMIDNMKYMDI